MSSATGFVAEKIRQPGDGSALALLALVGLALFSTSLSRLPMGGDDHRQLASVLSMEHPFGVLVGSWWGDHAYYRPLHTILLWVTAQVFGVAWWPHQAISLVLHVVNGCLLFLLLRAHDAGLRPAFAAAALYLVSIHTMTTVVWVAARTDLGVGACLLAFLLHVQIRRRSGQPPRSWVVLALGLSAILCKESGVLVLGMALLVAFSGDRGDRRARWQIVGCALGLLVVYALFRVAIFGTFAQDTDYEDRPLLLWQGRDLSELPPGQQLLGRAETVGKNVVALALPIFDNQGLLLPPRRLALQAQVWLLTPLLLAFAWRRPLRSVQVYGLAIAAGSALVHNFFYASYLLYLGHLGLCLVVGGTRLEPGLRRRAALVLCGVLVLCQSVLVARYQANQIASQRAALERWDQEGVPSDLDPALAASLLERR